MNTVTLTRCPLFDAGDLVLLDGDVWAVQTTDDAGMVWIYRYLHHPDFTSTMESLRVRESRLRRAPLGATRRDAGLY